MPKSIKQYTLIISGSADGKGEYDMSDIRVEAAVDNSDSVKLGEPKSWAFSQMFPYDGKMTLDELTQIVEQKIFADI